ncbi:MAG: redoxin domain-containing protein [Methanomassiliicoccales archaeon]
MKTLEKGMAAPDFTLKSPSGVIFNLKQALATGPAVVVFLPDAHNQDAQYVVDNFRDDLNEFKALRATVVPIVKASEEEVSTLQKEHELPFPVFPNPDASVFRKYGAMDGFLVKKPKKYACVVNPEGIITKAFRSVDANKLSRQSLYALRDQMGRSALKKQTVEVQGQK